MQFSQEAMGSFFDMAKSRAQEKIVAAQQRRKSVPKGLTRLERDMYLANRVDGDSEDYPTLDDLNGCRDLKEALKTNFTDIVSSY